MPSKPQCEFNHSINSIDEIKALLKSQGAELAILKALPKNANDKNQVYIASDFRVLHPTFAMTFQERGTSTSTTKKKSAPGKIIPEAVFDNFQWLKPNGAKVRAKNVKAIIYTQYPEARLSGFQTVENTMPRGLSVEFTKQDIVPKRLLIIAKTAGGGALGVFITNPSDTLLNEIKSLPSAFGSKICKKIELNLGRTERLENLLANVLGKTFDGCRLDKYGNTLPFKGTQVCGYTLEHACGIKPNSSMDGDIFGIELKAHTQPKVTLFTPEPDFGVYAEDFSNFMTTYGYKKANGDFRFTGIHRANVMNDSSRLTLKVRTLNNHGEHTDYNPEKSLTSQMDTVEVVLEHESGVIAAGWSSARLMNNWGSKHEEVVYVTASKTTNPNQSKREKGFEYEVFFEPQVLWCNQTSADHLFRAIHSGLIFLDPAPKYNPNNPSKNKRRCQWRVNKIDLAVKQLYDNVKTINVAH